jgi:hypothetical protein
MIQFIKGSGRREKDKVEENYLKVMVLIMKVIL